MAVNTDWMNDPSLAGIDRAKLDFLGKLLVDSASIDKSNKKELMGFLMSLSKLSKQNNISFTKEEFNLIYGVIQKRMTPDELAKMQQFSSLYASKNNKPHT